MGDDRAVIRVKERSIMAVRKKKKAITSAEIIDKYMTYRLESDRGPSNVYKFCKEAGIDEQAFYAEFGSLHAIDRHIWDSLLATSIATATRDKSFAEYTDQEKLLAVLFVFFENLTLNRSYVLLNLDHNRSIRDKVELFRHMKKTYGQFIDEVFEGSRMDMMRSEVKRLDDARKRAYREGFWTQLMFLIEFWRKDDSRGFEKTDIAIEKSVRAAMDLLDTSPFSSIIDFGKFLWKESARAF